MSNRSAGSVARAVGAERSGQRGEREALGALDNDTEGVSGTDTPDATDITDADIRMAVLRALWPVTRLSRLNACQRIPVENPSGLLPVRAGKDSDGITRIGFGGLAACGYWHSCPRCSARIAIQRSKELAHTLKVWSADNKSVGMVTLTLRHHRGDALVDLVKAAQLAWRKMTTSRAWDELRSAYNVEAVVRIFEATHGDNAGWHPHFHVLVFFDRQVSWNKVRDFGRWAWYRWHHHLAGVGYDAARDAVHIDMMREGNEESLGRYSFKLALEAFGHVFKRGRTDNENDRHRTPFQIMEDYAVNAMNGNEAEAMRDLALIHEWQTGMVQLKIPQAMWKRVRDVAASRARELGIAGPLIEDEISDQEIADREMEDSVTVGHMKASEWWVVRSELDDLKRCVRRGGIAAIQPWF